MKPLLLAPLFFTLSAGPAFCAVTDLRTVLQAAEKASNSLTASQAQEQVADFQVSIARGDYFPHIEADAIDTGGFPGSSSSLGIGGLVGSPYRSGAAAGVLATATVWDFGRTTAGVRSAEHLALAQKARTALSKEDLDMLAARLFFECVQYQTQLEAWSFMVEEARIVAKEVERFVSTGQRSIVERYLSRAQVQEALTNQTDFQQRMVSAQRRLRALTRLPLDRLGCPNLASASQPAPAGQPSATNPLLVHASENALAARAQTDAVKADYLPKLKAFAGVGVLENSRVVNKQDYAVGLGLTFPLFDGFRTWNGIKQAEASESARQSDVAAAQDEIDLVNAKYDQVIESSRVRLDHLSDELKLDMEGFKVAKNRYFSLQGNLVDLREALRNLMRARSEAIDVRTRYELAVFEREVFNAEMSSENSKLSY